MKFQTSDLIARINTHLEGLAREDDAADKKLAQENIDAEVTWIGTYGEAFREFASRIEYHLKRKQAITADMIPASLKEQYRTTLITFSPKSPRNSDNAQAFRLKTLRNMLEASEEATITPTSLKSLGFSDVSFLFETKAA